jgi:N-formylglutamate amidohydrolase
LVHRLEGEVIATGHRTALNTPYPGGYILSRHGRPDQHIHAIQIEIDRRLYLDANLTAPGKGLAGTAALLRRMIDAATDELLSGGLALAAE